jgi:hypothetical protein
MPQHRSGLASQHPKQRANPGAEQQAKKRNQRSGQDRYTHRCHAHVHAAGTACGLDLRLALTADDRGRRSGAHGHSSGRCLGNASQRNGVVAIETVHPEEASKHQDQSGQA